MKLTTFTKILLFVVLFFPVSLFSQDVIMKTDGSKIFSRVDEVTEAEVKYKKYSNLNGPVYALSKSDIRYIQYENGVRDVFSTDDKSSRSMSAQAAAAPAHAAVPARNNPNTSRTVNTSTTAVSSSSGAATITGTMMADNRNGEQYEIIEIGDQVWMKENLNYETENAVCYDNKEENCELYGRLYTWDDAVKACPGGWHLPTDLEWQQLEIQLGMPAHMASKSGRRGVSPGQGKMMKKGGSSGLDIEFAGNGGTKFFGGLGGEAYMWTATEDKKGKDAWIRLFNSFASVYRVEGDKEKKYSVRCVQD